MRVVVLGGTWFIGRAIVDALVAAGHVVLVAHRGLAEPADLPDVTHLHAERDSWPARRADFTAFAPDAAIDVSASNGAGAQSALSALPPGIRLVAVSSVDVYRAFEGMRDRRQTDMVPLTEDSPLRTTRYLNGPQWENLEVEEAYLAAGATILRLGAVYGEHDYQHRFEPVLRRLRAGRTQMPVGTGSWLFSRVYVGDVAQAALAALTANDTGAECFNIVETQTAPMRMFYEQIVAAADADLQLVRVRDDALPTDLRAAGAAEQHLLSSAQKAREILGWRDTAEPTAMRRAVQWHLQHPPLEWDSDFSADQAAMRTA